MKTAANNVVAGVKRKAEDETAAPSAKTVKTEVKVPVRAAGQSAQQVPSARQPAPPAVSSTSYRGTARGPTPVSTTVPASKPGVLGATTPASSAAGQPTASKPKKGFASLLEKAKAAQQAATASKPGTIRHKAVDKLTRRDRRRMEEAAAKKKVGVRPMKAGMHDRSRSGTPTDAKAPAAKKTSEPTYKGTMKRPIEKQEFTYKGTMNKTQSGTAAAKSGLRKGAPQDKYGGYASWSDLDEAEDEEEDYDSEGSSDMDAGFDDMAREETLALQAAKKEDQEALEEEERHRREKEERRRKLAALSKHAASKKKF